MVHSTKEEILQAFSGSEADKYEFEAGIINVDFHFTAMIVINYLKQLFPDRTAPIKVLDLGAGTGFFTRYILSAYPNAQVTLLDFSKDMLRLGTVQLKRGGYNYFEACLSDFILDPLPDSQFDLVISSYSFHHIRVSEDYVKLFRKIIDVLKPEVGTFFCIDYFLAHDKDYRIRQADYILRSWLQGFSSGNGKSISAERINILRHQLSAGEGGSNIFIPNNTNIYNVKTDEISKDMRELVRHWSKLIAKEDTPATTSEIFADLCEAIKNDSKGSSQWDKVTPLMQPIMWPSMSAIYGMTKQPLDKLSTWVDGLPLNMLVSSWKNGPITRYLDTERKIDSFPFDDAFENVFGPDSKKA